MDETRRRIIDKALEKFTTVGFAKTTMEEMASELGMSKKTLYKFFATKQILAEELIEHTLAIINNRCEAILSSPMSAVEKLAHVMKMIAEQQQRVATKTMLESLRRHAPHLWRRIETFRRERMGRNMRTILEQGKRDGTVRAGVHRDMFLLFLFGAIREGINPEALINAPYAMSDAFLGLMDIVMNGILTETGRKKFKKQMAAPVFTRPKN
jgi:AcrR family transcriptional regulator